MCRIVNTEAWYRIFYVCQSFYVCHRIKLIVTQKRKSVRTYLFPPHLASVHFSVAAALCRDNQ